MMEHESTAEQTDVQEAHEEREHEVHEPLYGLAPEPGGGGPASVGDPSQPRVEVPVEEPPEYGQGGINLTWGMVFGGVLLLFLLATILILGLGSTISSSPFTTYPLK